MGANHLNKGLTENPKGDDTPLIAEIKDETGCSDSEFIVLHPFPWKMWLELLITISIIIYVLYIAINSKVVSVEVIFQFLISKTMLLAVLTTLSLATLACLIAVFLGMGIALLRISKNKVLSGIAASYIFVSRGTPMLIQILFWFNALPVMIKTLHIQIPFSSIVLLNVPMINLITPFVAALLGLSLAETGYMAEVLRSGMRGVDRGQRDAARALGVTDVSIQSKIVIPQALRIVIPAFGNEYINMLKSTSLAMVIGVEEILRRASDVYSTNFRVMELLVVAAFWYLLLTSLVTLLQNKIETTFPAR
jgi:polar amino acid transport system permease protein